MSNFDRLFPPEREETADQSQPRQADDQDRLDPGQPPNRAAVLAVVLTIVGVVAAGLGYFAGHSDVLPTPATTITRPAVTSTATTYNDPEVETTTATATTTTTSTPPAVTTTAPPQTVTTTGPTVTATATGPAVTITQTLTATTAIIQPPVTVTVAP